MGGGARRDRDGRRRRSHPRDRDGRVRRRPHRLRRRGQHHRARGGAVPGRADVHRHAGRRADPVTTDRRPPGDHGAGHRVRGGGPGSRELVLRLRPGVRGTRADRWHLAAHGHRDRSRRAHLVGAVADRLRAAAALVRRESVGGRDARRQRLPLQVHRGRDLGWLRRARRGVPRHRRVQHLPRRPDRRPRLHRPGRDDLRQLASRRPADGCRLVRLHRRSAAAQRWRVRARPAAARRRRPAGTRRLAAPRLPPTRRAGHRRDRDRVPGLVPDDRGGSAGLLLDDALRRDAPRPGAGLATAANAGGRRLAIPPRAGILTTAGTPTGPDWAALTAAAREAMASAYAPYSRFQVGVAGLVDDGRVVVGCNVENASYGVGLCAECGLVSALHATGGGRLVAVACVGPDGEALMPCGRCRQLLWEHGGPSLVLLTARGPVPMTEVLPDAFGATDLVEHARP
ncbi:MAG: cytidine deaminase [Sporichthyaceae bacterium]|nr:cytidine deaminase [Sporichthyaceae bacterium]